MSALHLEFLVEEPSIEAFLTALLPRLLGERCTFTLNVFQGKCDLLAKLEARLQAYSRWLPAEYRIVVLVDQDDDNCNELKKRLEDVARRAGLSTRTGIGDPCWRLVNCIAIQELESWYFGDWQAVRAAFPRVQYSINRKEKFRDPDAITGTWEAFECVLKRHGYFQTGLRKIEAARVLGALVERERTQSRSFTHFCDAILEAAT